MFYDQRNVKNITLETLSLLKDSENNYSNNC
jgi:hypothetical protein